MLGSSVGDEMLTAWIFIRLPWLVSHSAVGFLAVPRVCMVDACRQGVSLKMGARPLWSSSFCMASLHRLTGDLSLGSFFFINVLAFLTGNKQAISCVLSQIWNTHLPTSPVEADHS